MTEHPSRPWEDDPDPRAQRGIRGAHIVAIGVLSAVVLVLGGAIGWRTWRARDVPEAPETAVTVVVTDTATQRSTPTSPAPSTSTPVLSPSPSPTREEPAQPTTVAPHQAPDPPSSSPPPHSPTTIPPPQISSPSITSASCTLVAGQVSAYIDFTTGGSEGTLSISLTKDGVVAGPPQTTSVPANARSGAALWSGLASSGYTCSFTLTTSETTTTTRATE